MQSTEWHSGDQRERLDVRILHRKEGLQFVFDDLRTASKRLRVADQAPQVHVDWRVDRRTAEREVTEFDGVEFPEFFGEPEVAGGLR